jgi:hypothetical protein
VAITAIPEEFLPVVKLLLEVMMVELRSYGKSANGDLPHRFGPLTQDVGYRRVNVAVTRAKRRMCVVSSFAWDEIDLKRSSSRGVELLKTYLAYAASGGTWFVETESAGGELNAFEADIKDELEGRGLVVRGQFGASRYRIDLVAMHPQKTGRPVLASVCDGASYHSSATARDRDRLRQAHLQRLGWRFHRIWSPKSNLRQARPCKPRQTSFNCPQQRPLQGCSRIDLAP